MNSTPTAGDSAPQADRAFERQLRRLNEVLLVSSVRQHELASSVQKTERALAKALAYADDIIATLREPFMVLDSDLRVKTANRSFYNSFHVSKEETENRFVYDLGNGQWDIPGLRTLLDEVLSRNQSVHDFEVEHSFPTLGRKTMLLNARPFPPDSKHPELILLAVEDVSALARAGRRTGRSQPPQGRVSGDVGPRTAKPTGPDPQRRPVSRHGGLGTRVRTARDVIARQVGHGPADRRPARRLPHQPQPVRRERRVSGDGGKCRGNSPPPHRAVRSRTHCRCRQTRLSGRRSVRLAQVFSNLLNNAAKYTKEGGHIWLTAEQEGDIAVLRAGQRHRHPPDVLPHIFDMFTQVDRSLDRSQGGLGIGLTLVRRLVEMHDGTIEVSAVSGKAASSPCVLPVDLPWRCHKRRCRLPPKKPCRPDRPCGYWSWMTT